MNYDTPAALAAAADKETKFSCMRLTWHSLLHRCETLQSRTCYYRLMVENQLQNVIRPNVSNRFQSSTCGRIRYTHSSRWSLFHPRGLILKFRIGSPPKGNENSLAFSSSRTNNWTRLRRENDHTFHSSDWLVCDDWLSILCLTV